MVNARADIVATGFTLGGLCAHFYAALEAYKGVAATLSTWLGLLLMLFGLIVWIRRGARWLASWRSDAPRR